jgi:predicted RNase H-like nuclease
LASVAGVDGCRGGWIAVELELASSVRRARVFGSTEGLFRSLRGVDVVAIDIPIGLLDAGPRECDREARRRLGPRRSSVFPPPIRPALLASTRADADRLTRGADGRGVGAQAFALYRKVREVDRVLRSSPAHRGRTHEVHPELSFQAQSGRGLWSKRTERGLAERRRLVDRWLGSSAYREARAAIPLRLAADDDLLDAFALSWSALRILRGEAVGLPDRPLRDRFGLAMQIKF